MPNVGGATSHSWAPSIGRILYAMPKALVAGLATFAGASNIRAAPVGKHGGGLTTEANALYAQKWLPQMQACLNEPWVHSFDPEPAIVECALRSVKNWESSSGHPTADVVISRTAFHHKIPCADAVSSLEVLTPHTAKEVSITTKAIVNGNEEFTQALDEAELQLFFHSSLESLSDLSSATTPYTARALFELLQEGADVETFKDTLRDSSLDFRIHEMVKDAGNLVDRLKPELRVTLADRNRFQVWLDTHFTSKPDALMNDIQVHSLLLLLAEHMNTKYSIGRT
ncbi:MAG TPA: hypothetical protein VIM98_16775 [Dyella sp.]|uniref:hypothetical protein n=1 Tax=Dyella sp. TaxID=1869338 RepID=UPI002F937F48